MFGELNKRWTNKTAIMKKILYLSLLTPIIYLASCSKSDVTPDTMEGAIIGKEWCLSNENKDGFLLAEDGKFYLTAKCQSNTLIGDWIIDGNLIKYKYTSNSQEITLVWGEVTEYSATQVNLLDYSDPLITIDDIYTLDTDDVYGCTNTGFGWNGNYNPDADCDDGSCDITEVYVDIIVDLNLPEYSNLQGSGNSIFIEGGVKGIIIYHGAGNDYKVYDRNCSYEPSLSCSQIETVDAGIAYCGCCTSAFLLSNHASVLNSPALLPLKEYYWTLSGNILRISN